MVQERRGRFYDTPKELADMKLSPFTRLALITVSLAFVQEVAYLDIGHDVTYFGQLTPFASASIRYTIIVVAVISVVCALVFRSRRRGA